MKVTNAIKYSSFIVTSLLVILTFITATSYVQLGIAIILYPFIALFAYKLFAVTGSDKRTPAETVMQLDSNNSANSQVKVIPNEKGDVSIKDIDKRAFLKVIGATGASFFLFSLLNRRVGSIFGGPTETGISTLTDDTGTKISPAEKQPTDGYRISEIDDQDEVYYGFVNAHGAWYVMKELDDGSFRYARGEQDFPGNWDHRDQLSYDYFHRVF